MHHLTGAPEREREMGVGVKKKGGQKQKEILFSMQAW